MPDSAGPADAMELSETERMFALCLRRRAEREAKRKLDVELRKAVQKQHCEAALEAAFDGDMPALLQAFDLGVERDCRDAHGTTLLSEAAAGGQAAVVSALLAEGADPNSRGRYGRTPLWRAAFSGSMDAARALLRAGADPRDCDEQGVRPIGVANGAPMRELLACWDTSVTDEMRAQQGAARQRRAEDADRERRAQHAAQRNELDEAVEEAGRRLGIARAEVGHRRALLQESRQQAPEARDVLDHLELALKEAERIALELNWTLQRAQLKRRDWESHEAQRQLKALGRLPAFRTQVLLESASDLANLMARLTDQLELKDKFECGTGEAATQLRRGDVALLEGPLLQGRSCKADLAAVDVEALEWPVPVYFNHGFDLVIRIQELSDVVFTDPGGRRRSDGRWPLVVDPSGTSSRFFRYSGATTFTVAELLQPSAEEAELSLRLRRALLKGLVHGGAVVVDLEGFTFPVEAVGTPFERLERGLFGKLTDRSTLYSYLLPRRFTSLVPAEHKQEFEDFQFVDEQLAKFVLCFVTSFAEPDPEFARRFFTIRVREPPSGADAETT